MSTLEPTVQVTQYAVNVYPDPDSINASLYEITVEYRGKGQWAVCWKGDCFDADGRRSYEPIPSERTGEWLARHRFDHDTAIELAKRIAPTLMVNGMTAAGCWEWEQNQRARLGVSGVSV